MLGFRSSVSTVFIQPKMDEEQPNGAGEKYISEAPETRNSLDRGGGKLIHCKHESLEYKDFYEEVRGLLDVKSLLEKCVILLDVKVCVSSHSFLVLL